MYHFLLLALVCLSQNLFARNLQFVRGVKYPNSTIEGVQSITTYALAPTKVTQLPGFSELIPYVIASPDQDEAGSCLYMSLTGVAEFWLAKLNPQLSRENEGPLDLSERHLMNLAGIDEDTNGIANWKTDSIFLYNLNNNIALNKNYRFTKSWYKYDENDDLQIAQPKEEGAEYGTSFNWINQISTIEPLLLVPLPNFQRTVLFADPESNQWNVGVMPHDIVHQVKEALLKNKAPVHVLYNHFGYWHATMIVGFDDETNNQNCSFVRDFISYMEDRPTQLRKQASETKDEKEKTYLLKAAERAEIAHKKSLASFQQVGCKSKGVFYVRDSIYGSPSEPFYDYDPSQKGDESPYSKKIVMHEYEWLTVLGNHAVQILLK